MANFQQHALKILTQCLNLANCQRYMVDSIELYLRDNFKEIDCQHRYLIQTDNNVLLSDPPQVKFKCYDCGEYVFRKLKEK